MRTVLKITGGILLAAVILIGGCVAIIGSGVEEAQEESDATAITLEEYQAAKVGEATQEELEARFGPPSSSDDIQAEGVEGIPESEFSQSCLYYGREGELASLFQFCFDGNGVLESKSAF